MPTAAKLISALLFAALAYAVADRVLAKAPEGTVEGWFREIMAAFGLFAGWQVLGPRAKSGFSFTLAAGLTASAVVAFLGLFFVAGHQMIVQSMRGAYGGPFSAIEDMMAIGGERATILLEPDVGGLLLLGGLVIGVAAHLAGRAWR